MSFMGDSYTTISVELIKRSWVHPPAAPGDFWGLLPTSTLTNSLERKKKRNSLSSSASPSLLPTLIPFSLALFLQFFAMSAKLSPSASTGTADLVLLYAEPGVVLLEEAWERRERGV